MPAANKKYMSIAGSVVREHLSFANHLWYLTGTGSRKAATAYISVRYQPFKMTMYHGIWRVK